MPVQKPPLEYLELQRFTMGIHPLSIDLQQHQQPKSGMVQRWYNVQNNNSFKEYHMWGARGACVGFVLQTYTHSLRQCMCFKAL